MIAVVPVAVLFFGALQTVESTPCIRSAELATSASRFVDHITAKANSSSGIPLELC
jgi:hypothetical protein